MEELAGGWRRCCKVLLSSYGTQVTIINSQQLDLSGYNLNEIKTVKTPLHIGEIAMAPDFTKELLVVGSC